MSTRDRFVQDINAINVPAALIGEVMIMWASLPSNEWKDFDRKLERVVECIAKKDSSEENLMLAMAVALRLMALDTLVMDPDVRGWLMPRSGSGIIYIHGGVLKVAAEEVILEGPDGEPIFASAPFRARLMALAAVKGHA